MVKELDQQLFQKMATELSFSFLPLKITADDILIPVVQISCSHHSF